MRYLKFLVCFCVILPITNNINGEETVQFKNIPSAYRLNYFLPFTYENSERPLDGIKGAHRDKVEAKYQLSLMIDLVKIEEQLFNLYYTQTGFWQAYNEKYSNILREVNYHVGFMLRTTQFSELYGKNIQLELSLEHASNGAAERQSRNQFKLIGSVVLTDDHSKLEISGMGHMGLGSDQDNPDIADYEGFNRIYYEYQNSFHLSGVLSGNIFEGHHALEVNVGYHFPAESKFMIMFQWHNGYMESLLDYNRYNNRFGVGFMYYSS